MLPGYYPSKDGKIPRHTFVKQQVDTLKDYFKKVIVIAPTGYFPKFLAKTGIFPVSYKDAADLKSYKYDNVDVHFPKCFNLPLKFLRERSGDLIFFFVKRYIKKNKITFDLIHAHFTWISGYLSKKLSELTKIPYFLTIQENMDWFLDIYYSNNDKYYDIWRNAETLIRVNKRDVPKLRKFNKNSLSVPNGYDPNIFKKLKKEDCRGHLDLPKSKKILLHVGSYIQNHKNQLSLIRACELLKNKGKDFICYLVGEGPDRILFQNEIKKLNLENYVKLIGRIPNKDVPIWMNASDLFVFPSYAEGNPTVVVEAMACGLPVIGSNGGGMDEVIVENETGFILENQEDENEIMNKIQKSLTKNWNIQKILDEAKEYSQKNIAKHLIEIYSSKK